MNSMYLRRAKHEQEMGRYWAALSRAACKRGAFPRAVEYQKIAALHYRDARAFAEYARWKADE